MERNDNTPAQPSASAPPDAAPYAYEEDTISLIDLVAVVVRHRLLIILGTILVGIVAVAALTLGPAAGLEIGPQTEYTGERRMLVAAIPPDISSYVAVDTAAAVRTILNDPQFIGEIYRPLELEPPPDRSPEEYLSMIRRNLINGDAYRISWDGNTRILTISYTAADTETVTGFLDAVVAALPAELDRQLAPRFAEAAAFVSETLDQTRETLATVARDAVAESAVVAVDAAAVARLIEQDGALSIISLNEQQRAITRLERFAASPAALLTPVGNPAIFADQSGSRSMIVIIATITAFFLAVFLAFVLEYVRRVREEPEEMEKLRSAWERR